MTHTASTPRLAWIKFIPLCLCLAACVGKDYAPPKLDFLNGWQSGWGGSAQAKDSAAGAIDFKTQITSIAPEKPGAHWADFEDADLTALLQMAETNNDDLMIAQARIDQARADEHAAIAALFPQGGGTTTLTRQTVAPPLQQHLDSTNQIGFNGSWDLDLAGANKRKVEAADAEIAAAEQDKAQTELAVQTEVARNYIELRDAQQQYAITQQNLEMQNYTLTVTAAQRDLGAISDFELMRAKAQVQDTASRLPTLRKSMDAAINRLSVLTETSPQVLQPMLSQTKTIPSLAASAVVGMPLTVIEQRPDVHAAERRLAQAAALRNAAFAGYFPDISLQGFWGRQHDSFYDVGGPMWSGAINGILPILNLPAIRAQVSLQDARQSEAFYTYRQTVFKALEDTDNAITAYLTEIDRRNHLRQEAQSFDKAADIALEQYKVGTATQLDLLVAERDKLNADTQLMDSEAAVAENLVLLYRALGESWDGQNAKANLTMTNNEANQINAGAAISNHEMPIGPSANPPMTSASTINTLNDNTQPSRPLQDKPTTPANDFLMPVVHTDVNGIAVIE